MKNFNWFWCAITGVAMLLLIFFVAPESGLNDIQQLMRMNGLLIILFFFGLHTQELRNKK